MSAYDLWITVLLHICPPKSCLHSIQTQLTCPLWSGPVCCATSVGYPWRIQNTNLWIIHTLLFPQLAVLTSDIAVQLVTMPLRIPDFPGSHLSPHMDNPVCRCFQPSERYIGIGHDRFLSHLSNPLFNNHPTTYTASITHGNEPQWARVTQWD